MRIYGEVPPDYSGPVLYRTADHSVGRRTIYSYAKFEKRPLTEELNRLHADGSIRKRGILTPGLIVDENGDLLPKWREPRKLTIIKNKPLPYELYTAVHGLMTERIHDAIVSLEPREHIFFPLDATFPDGSIERMYRMEFGKAYLAANYISHECFFSLSKHAIKSSVNAVGDLYFLEPDFMIMGGTISNDFFYLNKRVVRSRHLFTSDFGASGRFVSYFSQELMGKFQVFGDIFSENADCVRIGVAD